MQNAYRLLLLAILLLNLLYKFRLTFNKAEKTKHKKVNFVHLLSFFFSDKHSSKAIRRERILYIPNNFSTTGHLPFLVWGGVRATTGELRPRNGPEYARRACSSTSGDSVYVIQVWHV